MKNEPQESRLSRWSRRKLESAEPSRLEEITAEVEPPLVDNAIESAEDAPVQETETPLCDADMEPIESLTENSDFSKFMSPGVSDELRNLALRKMFKAPFFNIRDGLDEYDEDYTSFEKLGDIVTADMRHQMELEAERKLAEETETLIESKPESETDGVEARQEPDEVEEVTEDAVDTDLAANERAIDDQTINPGPDNHESLKHER